MREAGLDIPVIVQTAHGGIDNVVTAMRAGAMDFVVKPVGVERLLGIAAQRPGDAGARRRDRPPKAQPQRHADVPRHHHPQRQDARGAARRRKNRELDDPGADRRRIRRRQGTDRARDPRLGRAPRQALRRGELRRACRRIWSNRSCSVTRRAPSRAPPSAMTASSSRPRAAPCSSTRSANCRRPRRSSCCGRSRKARSSRSAEGSPSRSNARMISATNRNLIERRQIRAVSRGPVLSPARVPDHGAAAARARRGYPGTDAPFPGPLCRRGGQARSGRCRPKRCRCCPPIAGPAMCASWRTPSSARSCWRTERRSACGEFPQIAAQIGDVDSATAIPADAADIRPRPMMAARISMRPYGSRRNRCAAVPR